MFDHPESGPAASLPRPEYPRPQLRRDAWANLNGTWQFEIDCADTGLERGLLDRELGSEILVPFAPESEASGIGHTDFMEAVWYRRTFEVPASWEGQRIILHFGAVDHDATVWVNGAQVTRHRGGFTPFSADITDHARPGSEAVIVVRARDSRHALQARGKQATWYANTHCQYTRTTGIWQTVWAEPVPAAHIERLRVTPNLATATFAVEVPLSANRPGYEVRARLTWEGRVVAEASAPAGSDFTPSLTLALTPADRHVWGPGEPALYGLDVELIDADGAVCDAVSSYAGLRSVTIDGQRFLINGKPVFQRLVLDQGYWPGTLMTAPSDADLVRDIELALAAGFNGARLHEKVFEERYLYHADRMGFIVWGEFGDWGVSGQGLDGYNQAPTASFVAEWLEAVRRDYNHPAIVGWCPLNETHEKLHDHITQLEDVTRAMFLATKAADPTRPVIDASGYSHRVPETDVYDSHSYEQDPELFAKQQAGLAVGAPYVNERAPGVPVSLPYAGQPYFVSEFGGIWWNPDAATAAGDDQAESWGYGQRVASEEEFYERFAGLVNVLAGDPLMFGYCYTQLTDVFQEQNGIYRFDRSAKLDVTRIREAQSGPAAYEGGQAADGGRCSGELS